MRDDHDSFYPARNPQAGLDEDRRAFVARAATSLRLPSLFYASLRDPHVFEAVVGRPLTRCDWETVSMPEHALAKVVTAAGCELPAALLAGSQAQAGADGLLVHDLSRFEQTMVAWYEWDEYALRQVTLADGRAAQVFLPDYDAIVTEHGAYTTEPWSFARWQARQRDETLAVARRWMAQRPDDESLIAAGCFPPAETSSRRRAAG